MTAISTIATRTTFHHIEGPARLAHDNYDEEKLRCTYEDDVRPFDQVLTDQYGPEGSGWEFRKASAAARLGQILVHADGDAYFWAKHHTGRTE